MVAAGTTGRLQGTRVLVTRPRERSEELCFLLEDEGAEVVALPVLELMPPDDPRPLRAAAEQLQRYAWIAFASPLAVDALLEAVRQAGTWDLLSRPRLAAVGPRTARQLRQAGLEVHAELETGGGVALGALIRERLEPGDEVLLPAAEHGREELQHVLEDSGVRVVRVCAYRSVRAELPPAELDALAARPPHAAIFASPRTAEAFLEALGGRRELAERMKRVAIGPTTAAALERLGLPAQAVASRPTSAALVDATVAAVQGA